jgi:hypothetical protein
VIAMNGIRYQIGYRVFLLGWRILPEGVRSEVERILLAGGK